MTYLDSTLVVDTLDIRAARQQSAFALLVRVGTEVCVSELVRMESSIRAKREQDKAKLDQLNGFFAEIRVLGFPAPVFEIAGDLRAEHNLKTPDALHIACALHHGCTAFATADLALTKLSLPLRWESY